MSEESASRRRVLTVLGVGGVAAIASQAGQRPAGAATGDPMLLGSNNEADASTSLASGALGSALAVTNTNPTGFGISGIASGGVGVHGHSDTSAGIAAHSGSGPAGYFTTDTGHAIQAGGRALSVAPSTATWSRSAMRTQRPRARRSWPGVSEVAPP